MKRSCSVLLAVLATSLATTNLVHGADPVQQPEGTAISYTSLEEATKALRAKPGVTFRNQGGWLVAEDTKSSTVWLLTQPDHPAYPSIVRRTLVNAADGAYVETNVRCFASKKVCDKYFGGK